MRQTEAGGAGTADAAGGRDGATDGRTEASPISRRGEGEGEDDGRRGGCRLSADDAVAAYPTTGAERRRCASDV
jgi:hypothetical protein